MAKLLKRIAIGLAVLIFLGGVGALLLFNAAEWKIADRMNAPHLQIEREPANDLIYKTLDGRQEHLAASKGQVVFLNLWGTWCIQCVAEMPRVQQLYDHYKNDPHVKFLIVSRLDSPATVRFYARRNHLTLPFFTMRDEDIPESMQLDQYPATFLFAKDGTLVSHHVGAADWSDRSVISFLDRLKDE